MGFANEKDWGISKYFLGYFSNGEGVDFVDTLSRNQDFDLLRQKNKQTSSISLKASKLAVFLVGNEFRLRIPFGKRICFPSPSAASKLLCLQSEIQEKILYLFLCPATEKAVFHTDWAQVRQNKAR